MSVYEAKLTKICESIESMPGTGGARALRSIVMDLEGNGPVGELLHTLDQNYFEMVIDLFQEFRSSGRYESFNSIHREARERLEKKEGTKH